MPAKPNPDMDERVAIPLDPELAISALLQVDPNAEEADTVSTSDNLTALLLRRIFELGPLRAEGIAREAGDIDQFGTDDARGWAEQQVENGLLEPSEADPHAWQITDAGRRRIGDDPGR
jgi:hypothetical protein